MLIKILDSNDNKPEFLTYQQPLVVSVPTSKRVGDMVAKIEVCSSFY